jgi:hypothetical protein
MWLRKEVEEVVEKGDGGGGSGGGDGGGGDGWRRWWGRRWSLHGAGGRSLFVFSLSATVVVCLSTNALLTLDLAPVFNFPKDKQKPGDHSTGPIRSSFGPLNVASSGFF